MNKMVCILLVATLLIGGTNAIANSNISKEKTGSIILSEVIEISEPIINENNGFIKVTLPEQTSYILNEGKPILPMVSKTFNFPVGTDIEHIDVTMDFGTYTLTSLIEPGPQPLPLNKDIMKDISIQTVPDPEIYQQDLLFPQFEYSVKYGVGIADEEHVIFVTIYCYSQYNPVEKFINVPSYVSINIEYHSPTEELFLGSGFDMLIITDERFVDQLQPLVDHKNNIGISTTIATVQDIYQEYNGRDDAEDVKLKIKDAVEQYGVKYVLLVGGHVGQTHDWYVPVRYSHNFDGAFSGKGIPYDPKYVSDLYFSDIYRYSTGGQPIFEDWDRNGNNIFGEFNSIETGESDIIDFYPDVYVGRLPVRYSWEVDIMIDKIITYETSADDSWFKRGIVVGGDTSAPARGAPYGIYEGELVADLVGVYLDQVGFNIERLYTSDGSFSDTDDFINAVNKGAGFLNVEGHGSPSVWGNFLPDAEKEEDFVYGYTILDMRLLENGEKLPVLVNGGCHNAQFNVTMQHIFDHGGLSFDRAGFDEYVPHDTCSWFLLEGGGGSIASIGNTALGYGYINQYVLEGLSGWLNPRLFHAYAIQGMEYLGDAHGQAIIDYINKLGSFISDVNEDSVDRKTIEEWVLLGDPSLKLGGYGIGTLSTDESEDDDELQAYLLGDVAVPVWDKGMSWTYSISDIDIALSEIEGRSLSASVRSGNLYFQIIDVTSEEYIATLSTSGLEMYVDVNIDLNSDVIPLIKGVIKLQNASLVGQITFTKDTLAISNVDVALDGSLDTETILRNVDMQIPDIVLKLIPEIPLTVSIQVAFNHPYEIVQFPLSLGKEWPLLENNLTITGTIESPYFRLLNIVNKVTRLVGIRLLPQAIEKYLPVIDIVEVLNDYNMTNVFELPELTKIFRKSPFICKSESQVETEIGLFNCYNIWFTNGAGELYYSPDAKNIVRINGNIKDFIPIVENVTLELIDSSV